MAKFMNINGCYLNIDQIISVKYEKNENKTLFVFSDSEFSFAAEGDLTSSVLNANNELTLHDKLLGRYIVSKLKDMLSLILSRLDYISKVFKKGGSV